MMSTPRGSCHARKQRGETTKQQDGARRQRSARDQRRHHASEDDDGYDHERQRAVVDEQSGQLAQRVGQDRHDRASALGRRASATAATLTAKNIAANMTIAKSAPGQATPRPSPVQNTPNADSMMPTANLSVFSGTRANGRCTIKPTAATARHAATAPTLAGTSIPRPAPSAITIKTTSSPSRRTALKVVSAPIQSSRASLRRA